MEERRFDDLTRVLGTARSRRQVFKGLLGGLVAVLVGGSAGTAPVTAAGVCNRAHCREEAFQIWKICNQNCGSLSSRHGYDRNEDIGCVLACSVALRIEQSQCDHNASGCFGNAACCNQRCVSLDTDPDNCGACGHICHPGESCSGGQCQCGDNGTVCNGQCTDTKLDSHNCGSCGHVCPSCQACVDGDCVDVDCGSGNVCCHDQCVSTCAEGLHRDPATCECVGGCTGVSCGTCNECNPDTGQCEPVENGTSCAGDSGYGCCNGQCNQYPGTPCCPTSQQDVCGDTCCEPGTGCALVANADDNAVGNAQTCCPVSDEYPVPGTAKPGGECCPAGEEAFHITPGYCPSGPSVDEWICCPITAVGLYACCAYA